MSEINDIARIAHQEQQLVFSRFDENDAWKLGSTLYEMALERGLGIVIDMRRPGHALFGHPLFYAALPGTTPDHADWIRRKSNLTLRFHRSSYAIGLEMLEKKSSVTERYGLALADYASHGGSVPIRVEAAGVVGAVTVSGLPQRADHELAIEALCRLTGKDFETLRLP
jgi:uncharacterized protein (UPF0303 family)